MTWMRDVKHILNGSEGHACACIGPQGNEPVCPCAMKSVFVKDGRYKQIIDLGPAPSKDGERKLKIRDAKEY